MNVFELVAKLSLDTSEYEEELGKSSEKANGFGSKISGGLKTAGAAFAAVTTAAAAVGAAAISAAGDVAQYGDNIDKASQKMGVSAEFYQEWDAVLQHSGTSMSAMTQTFKTLANASQDASADQQAAFEKLGLSMEQVKSMSAEDLFATTISRLQDMGESTERTALATDLLGRGAMEMGALLNTSSEDTQKMIDTVHELGGVMSDDAVKAAAGYQDALQDLQTSFSGLKNNMVSEFLPGITTTMNGLAKLFSGSEGGAEAVRAGIEQLSNNILEQLPVFFDTALQIVEAIGNAIIENLPQIIQVGVELIIGLATGLIKAIPEIVKRLPEIIGAIVTGFRNSWGELRQAGADLLSSFWDGVVSIANQITTWVSNWWHNLWAGKTSTQSNVQPGGAFGGRAGGLDFVPYNGFNATLHRGEAVLTSREAEQWRNGGKNNAVDAATIAPIVLNVTEQIDGMTLARNQYKYNLMVSRNHGVSLTNA